MKIVFWLDMLSAHMAPFINSLARRKKISLVVNKLIEKKRTDDGWSIPKYHPDVEIFVHPNKGMINALLATSDCLHVFFGINAYPLVFKAFKKAIRLKKRIIIMQEPIHWVGKKGMFRIILWLWFRLRYSRGVLLYLNTGYANSRFVNRIIYSRRKLYDWAYFIDMAENMKYESNRVIKRKASNVIYIGSINNNKNIIPAVLDIQNITDDINQFIIIGIGPLEAKLQQIIQGSEKIKYLGGLKREHIWPHMNEADLLILPSKWDGWGYVVNEALLSGIPVISSNKCGSSILLDGDDRGEVFQLDRFKHVLGKWIRKGPVSNSHRDRLRKWSLDHISGEVGSEYFLQCIESALNNHVNKPIVPWKN